MDAVGGSIPADFGAFFGGFGTVVSTDQPNAQGQNDLQSIFADAVTSVSANDAGVISSTLQASKASITPSLRGRAKKELPKGTNANKINAAALKKIDEAGTRIVLQDSNEVVVSEDLVSQLAPDVQKKIRAWANKTDGQNRVLRIVSRTAFRNELIQAYERIELQNTTPRIDYKNQQQDEKPAERTQVIADLDEGETSNRIVTQTAGGKADLESDEQPQAGRHHHALMSQEAKDHARQRLEKEKESKEQEKRDSIRRREDENETLMKGVKQDEEKSSLQFPDGRLVTIERSHDGKITSVFESRLPTTSKEKRVGDSRRRG